MELIAKTVALFFIITGMLVIAAIVFSRAIIDDFKLKGGMND